jgi:hypothetical protein
VRCIQCPFLSPDRSTFYRTVKQAARPLFCITTLNLRTINEKTEAHEWSEEISLTLFFV